MADTPSKHVSFASKTVKAGNNGLDEISNEDFMCEVDPEYSTHGNWNWIPPGSINVPGSVCFPG